MKILITGSNGLLGQKLSTLLATDPGIEFLATARSPLSTAITRGQFSLLDVSSAQQLRKVVEAFMPEIIIHTAAMTQVDDCEDQREKCWEANVTAVENLIAVCDEFKIHLVHISTDFIFDGTVGPLSEEDLPNPVNYYGESKLAAEKLIQASSISWSILRTVLVYGITPGMSRSNIVLWVKNSLEQGKTIQVVNDQWRTPTLAEDLAKGCYLAAIHKARGIYNISGKDFLSPYEMAIQTAEYFRLDTSKIVKTDSSQFTQRARRPLKTGFIIDKARKELGYEPHTFMEGLAIMSLQL